MQDGDREAGRTAEAEEADAFAGLDTSDPKAAKADDAGAEQRRDVNVIKPGGQRIDEIRARQGIFGVASVDGVAGEDGVVAEVFHAVTAVPAIAIDAAHPGDSDARSQGQLRVAPSATRRRSDGRE